MLYLVRGREDGAGLRPGDGVSSPWRAVAEQFHRGCPKVSSCMQALRFAAEVLLGHLPTECHLPSLADIAVRSEAHLRTRSREDPVRLDLPCETKLRPDKNLSSYGEGGS